VLGHDNRLINGAAYNHGAVYALDGVNGGFRPPDAERRTEATLKQPFIGHDQSGARLAKIIERDAPKH
jgi:hypothetical protein